MKIRIRCDSSVERENMKKQEMLHVVCAVVVSVVSRFAGIRMESSLVDA